MNTLPFDKITKMRFHLCGAVIFLGLFITSCNKDDDKLGLGVYPDNEQLGLITTDTFTIHAKTVALDSIASDDLLLTTIGSYVDNEFGFHSASVSAQFIPSTATVNFGDLSSLVVDSVCLSMVYQGYYGQQVPHNFQVRKLTELMIKDSTYYSNRVFAQEEENLLDITRYTPNYEQRSIAEGEEPEQLRLSLDNSFGEQLINQVATSTDVDVFLNEFKGIHISSIPEFGFGSGSADGYGTIWYFDLANDYSKVTVYYHNDEGASSYNFNFSTDQTKVNHFTHDYSDTPVELALNDSTLGKEVLYLQGMAGLAIDFQIPYLEGLIDDGAVSINKAELVFTIEDNTTSTYNPELEYFVAAKTSNGSYTFTLDDIDVQIETGGSLSNGKEYRFVINRDMQFLVNSYLEGSNENFGYRLLNTDGAMQSARSILKGTQAGEGEVKLIVSYTPI